MRIGQANFDCDYAYFRAVEATEFIYTDSSGGITTRDEDLAGEATCVRRRGTFALSEERIMLYDSTAVYNAVATSTTKADDGSSRTRRWRFTDVLIWREGRWQLVAGHSSLIRN